MLQNVTTWKTEGKEIQLCTERHVKKERQRVIQKEKNVVAVQDGKPVKVFASPLHQRGLKQFRNLAKAYRAFCKIYQKGRTFVLNK